LRGEAKQILAPAPVDLQKSRMVALAQRDQQNNALK
jgi:hypothetical protein